MLIPLESLDALRTRTGPWTGVAGLAWAGEELLGLGSGGELLAWDLDLEPTRAPARLPGGHALSLGPAGELLLGTHAGLWRMAPGGGAPARVPGPERGVRAVAWLGGRGYAAGDEGVLWAVEPEGAARALSAPGPQIQHLSAASGQVLTVDALGVLRTWGPGGEPIAQRELPDPGPVLATEHGLVVASGSALLWLDAALGEQDRWEGAEALVLTAEAEAVLGAFRDGRVRRFWPGPLLAMDEPSGHRGFVSALAAGPGRLASAARDRSLRVWPGPTRRAVPAGVLSVGVGGGQLWSTDGAAVRVWDAERGLPIQTLPIAGARAVAPLPGGYALATLGGELQRWERGAEAPSAVQALQAPVEALAAARGAVLVRAADGVFVHDPLTLARLGPADEAEVPRSDGPWWAWTGPEGPTRALFARGEALAIWQSGALRGADEALDLLRWPDGRPLRSP